MATGKAEVKVSSVARNLDSAETIANIRKFVVQNFPLARRRTLTDNDNLLESGVIDSLGVLELVTFLQQEFALKVEDDELTPENFQDIHSIAQFVEQRREAQ
jgi:acyl carrier protein